MGGDGLMSKFKSELRRIEKRRIEARKRGDLEERKPMATHAGGDARKAIDILLENKNIDEYGLPL